MSPKKQYFKANNPVDDNECFQYKVKKQAEDTYKGKEWWKQADTDLSNAYVRPTSRKIAKKIILEYEWLGTLPPGTTNHYGIFFDNWACGGVCCFGSGANIYAHEELGIKYNELSYLVRGACTHWTPQNTNSKLISYSLKHEKETGKKVAIAYADTDAGEVGQLYQATNWLCIGKTGTKRQFVHPETNRPYNEKIIGDTIERNNLNDVVSWSEMKQRFLDRGWKVQKTNPKWKYIYILADGDEEERIKNNIEDQIVDYPKRE